MSRWNLGQRFNVASFFVLLIGALIIGWWVGLQIKTSVIHEAAATTALYLDSFTTPNLQELETSHTLSAESIESIQSLLTETDIGRQIVAIKVWDQNGQILYSNNPSLVGLTFPGGEDLELAWNGQVVAIISDLQEEENVGESQLYDRLLEIYIPIRLQGSHQVIAVAEFYQKVESLEAEILAAQKQSWIAVGTSMGMVYLLLILFFQNTRRRIGRQEVALKNQVAQLTEVLSRNDELDHRILLATANTATLNERLLRRISAELNDGPVRDMQVSLARLDQVLNANAVCELANLSNRCNENLPIIRQSIETAQEEIRSITNGLGLPHLASLTLPEVFVSVVKTYESRSGKKVSLSLGNLPAEATLPVKITAYRLVQEALNNSNRHAGGAGQEVRAGFQDSHIQIEISDRGPGFDTTRFINQNEHLGLAGMRERVESLGGHFAVTSQINEGTRITASLLVQSRGEYIGE